jgi:hypothetical protein
MRPANGRLLPPDPLTLLRDPGQVAADEGGGFGAGAAPRDRRDRHPQCTVGPHAKDVTAGPGHANELGPEAGDGSGAFYPGPAIRRLPCLPEAI